MVLKDLREKAGSLLIITILRLSCLGAHLADAGGEGSLAGQAWVEGMPNPIEKPPTAVCNRPFENATVTSPSTSTLL